MAVRRPLIHAAQAPPLGPRRTFLKPSRGPASPLWWTPSALQWWPSPSLRPNPSPADTICTPHVSLAAPGHGAVSHFLFSVSKAPPPILLCTDGPLARSLHHQPSSSCPHSHGTPQLTPQPPAQGDYVIPHTVTFHPSLPSHPSGHAMTPAPPPPLSTHHLSGSGAALAQHLPSDHQTLPHHIPALGASVQRLHQHEMLQRMEVQRRRLMQHPT